MAEQTSKFSYTGILVGAIAFLLVLVHFWAGPFSPQPALEQTVAEKAVAIRNATIAALKGEKVEKKVERSEIDIDNALDIAGAVMGGIAIILGVLGYARKEPLRVAGGAAVLGAGAIAFQFAVIALGAIILAILIAAVLSQLGFS